MVEIKLKGGYVSRGELLSYLYTCAFEKADGKCKVSKVISRIETMPAADVAPVVHAHWITEIVAVETVYGTDMKERAKCSKCKHKFLGAAKTFLFCPCCGAKMDEEA